MRSRFCAAALAGLAVSGVAAGQATAQDDAPPTVEFGARAFIDYVEVDGDRQTGADFEDQDIRLRLGRVWAQGDLTDRLSYKAELDFGLEDVVWQDVYLALELTESTKLTVGNIKTLSLENLTSDAVTTFMERGPYNDVLGLGRLVSLEAKTGGDNWTAAAAVTGESLNDIDTQPQQVGVSLRGTFAPLIADRQKAHLGAWVRQRDRDAPSRLNYRARPNTNFGPRFVSTSSFGESDTTLALEGAYVNGPFSLQGEWAHIDVDGTGRDAELSTWYAYGSWFVTGQSRRYRPEAGRFDRVKVENPVTKGGLGAIELALRYDVADLSDAPGGGEYSGWTLGANWHLTSNTRVMVNYTDAENDNVAPGADVDAQVAQVRFQFEF
jgi:phosphate-selective porin OprO/OprP